MLPIVYRKIMDREYLSCAIRYVERLAIYDKDDYGYAASLGFSVKRCRHRNITYGNLTAHILSHYVPGKTHTDIRADVVRFAREQMEFTRSRAEPILSAKKLTVEEYLETLSHDNQPFDEIAIMLFARQYETHIVTFFSDMAYSTMDTYKIDHASIYLAYRGGMQVDELVHDGQCSSEEMEVKENPFAKKSIPQSGSQGKARMKVTPTKAELAKQKAERAKQKAELAKQKAEGAKQNATDQKGRRGESRSYPDERKKPYNTRSQSPKHSGRSSRTSQKAGFEFLPDEPKQARHSKSSKHPVQVKSSQDKDGRPVISLDTTSGKIKLKTFAIAPRRRKRVPKIKCMYPKGCNEKFTSQKLCNEHMRSAHPNYRFGCNFCDRKFQTYNAWYKHEDGHAPAKHKCEYCGKEYQFPQQLTDHRQQHKSIKPIPCTGCKRRFGTNRAMLRHAVVHQGLQLKCDFETQNQDGTVRRCSLTFASPEYLKQHKQGAHGDGWKVPCGQSVDWPSKIRPHKRDCKECQSVLLKQEKQRLSIRKRLIQEQDAHIKYLQRKLKKVARKK